MHKLFKSRVAAVSAGALLVVGLGSTAAVARDRIGSDDLGRFSIEKRHMSRNAVGAFELEPGSVRSHHLANGLVRFRDLAPWVRDQVDNRSEVGGLQHRVDALETQAAAQEGLGDYEVFTSTQNFSPGGIGAAWCGAPEANTEDEGWRVISGGAQLTTEDVDAGVVVVSAWPNYAGNGGDPLNPGWNVQLNKPTNYNPGDVTLYAVCAKVAEPSGTQ